MEEKSLKEWREIFVIKTNPDKTAAIKGIKKYLEVIDIPEKIGEYTVTEISEKAFYKLNSKEMYKSKEFSVVIPDTVLAIGESAFYECKWMKSVKLSKNLKEISPYSFICTGLDNIVIPDSVKEIGDHAFAQCSHLETVQFSSNLQKIGDEAFLQCSSIKELQFPKKLKSIGYYAFGGADALQEIVIPDSVKILKNLAFGYCRGVRRLVLPKKIKRLPRIFGEMSELKELELPYGLEKIDPGVFSHCYALEKLFIPETVAEIGIGQFEFAKKVEIYSPAGCYAEQYAKENNIPWHRC